MSLIGNTPKTFDKKRIIDQQTLLKQQTIEYIKKAVLASKLILDEDFDALLDTPLIFLPHVVRNYRPIFSTSVSTIALLTISKFIKENQRECAILALLPVSYEIISIGRHWYKKYKCFKQIDEFVYNLEQQALLNNKVIKHLNMRINSMVELQNKINEVAFGLIQVDDLKFASFACRTLENVCVTLQEQLVIHATYSESYYSYIGNWHMDSCPENGKIEEITMFIEKLSEFYILIASNLMSSSIFSLEAAMWRSNQDFETVFNTIKHATTQIKQSRYDIEKELKQVFYDFHKTSSVPKQTTNNLNNKQKQLVPIYNDSLDDCKNRLRIVFDLTKSIESQNAKTRCIFLEEMMENLEASTLQVRNLLRYEKSLLKPENADISRDCEQNHLKTTDMDTKKEVINHKEAEIGSDDEEFGYSPHESDDDFDRKCLRNNEDYDRDAIQSVAVQNLMLQELRNRMKDVRRIKITRTATGDLIVQERPVTLQESGGQTEPLLKKAVEKSQENLTEANPPLKFNLFQGDVPPPPPPCLPNMKFNNFGGENIDKSAIQPVSNLPVNKTLLSSISSIAMQRNQNEDVFGCDGDEYVASDEFSSDDD